MKALVLRLIAASLFLLALLLPGAAANAAGGGQLSKHDRELLVDARAQGKTTIMVLFASANGANATVASGLQSLGARIRYRDDDISYIRALVPTAKVEAAAGLNGVQSVSLDELIPLEDPTPEAIDNTTQVNPPGATTPPLNPYMPTQDIGAPQFVTAHPTFDGRGVKIGIVDGGVDLLAPELQTAKALDGTPVRKIVDWVNTTDPLSGLDASWINMQAQVTVVGGTFTASGNTYTGVGADGTYRFGVFAEDAIDAGSEYNLGSNCGNDLNRNGVCHEKFAILWRTSDNMVWVDRNADQSFAGEPGLTDYKVNYDVSLFGTDNPATAVRESVPFVIQTDGKDKYVNIGVVGNAHGTHVAGIAAGKDYFGGAFDGAAPEAQIVSVRVCIFGNSCTSSGILEGMIYAEKQANVDVINMSIGGLPALNDGNTARDLLFNRLIDLSKAQMFFSAGNSGPGINTVGDPSVATKVMSVGAYVTKDTWLANYGNVIPKTEGLFAFSSRGPREDGGLKPNIVAPGSAVSTIPAWQPVAGQCLPYTCAPGYAMFNGTSMASPEATGGAALLISAAKQSNVQYKPEQLRQAINSSAHFVPGYAAHEQGNGLFQVGAAWDLLKQNIKAVDITSKAPVNTIISQFLATPNKGPGIYEREGWVAGQTASRTITFTRTSGGTKAITYNLTWVGNDGTFSSAGSISLPLKTAVNLTVNINAATAGVHSALLYLDDPATAGIDYQVLNTIVAAEQFNIGNNYTVAVSGTADAANKASYFFYVPAKTPAYKVDLAVTAGRARLWRFHPYGTPYPSSASGVTGYCTAPCTLSMTTSNPMAGVWEADVEVSRSSTVTPAAFNLTASILGVDINPTSWTVDPATVGTTYTQLFSFTNRFGAFTGGATGTALGSAFASRPTIAAGALAQVVSINVPSGTTNLSASIGNASDSAADLDLYLYDCHTGPCVLKASSTGSTAEESVSFSNPAAGLWKALIDPYAVPSGSTQYNYLDVITNPMYGAVTVTDPAALHGNGASWSATASATAAVAPETGRFLRGFVQVKSGSTVLGQAQVSLNNVSP